MAGVKGEAATQDGVSAISANFNGTPIRAGDFIWFSSALKVQGLGSDPVTIGFAGSIQFAANGSLYLVSVPNGFPGGIKQVTWQGMFFSLTPGLKVQWQWAAAVYHNADFATDYNLLGVKPVDDNSASVYLNSDHAGTPENFKSDVVGGARGGGGSNFTGSYSGTAATVPSPANIGAACGGS
jgi:hypothetical protein